LAPCVPSVETFALHNAISHQAQPHMVLLGAFGREGLRVGGPPIACLTGFEPELALQHAEDCFDLLALPVEGPDRFGTEAEPVGRVVLAAVSHHKDLEVAGHIAYGMPIGLLQIPGSEDTHTWKPKESGLWSGPGVPRLARRAGAHPTGVSALAARGALEIRPGPGEAELCPESPAL
jgi:hypothetical protein